MTRWNPMDPLTLVDRRGPDDCWPWQGRVDPKGYGRTGSRMFGTELAHRVIYGLLVGPPPPLPLLHSCDNPPCCNPAHLEPGTTAENNRQMAERGRARNGGLSGEAHGRAKLTEADVATIRASTASQRELATQYGVSQSSIWRARHGLTWGM